MLWFWVAYGGDGRYRIVYIGFEKLGYHRCMAVIHISRAEAASNFDGLMARAANGDEILIDDASPVLMKRAVREPGRFISEIIASAEARGSNATLDEDFGRDLEDIINSHREPLDPPVWD